MIRRGIPVLVTSADRCLEQKSTSSQTCTHQGKSRLEVAQKYEIVASFGSGLVMLEDALEFISLLILPTSSLHIRKGQLLNNIKNPLPAQLKVF